MERKILLTIAGILLFSLIAQIGTVEAQADPRFRIENSTQTVFDVDVAGNVWINQTLTVQDISCADSTCIDDSEIGDLSASKLTSVPSAWGRGNTSAELELPAWVSTNTTEQMQDAAGAMATSGDGVDITYNDGANTLTTTFDCSDVIDADKGLVCNGENLNAYLPTCASGNHLYVTAGNFSCEADDKGIDSLSLDGDTGSETLGDGDTITIIGGSGGIDVAVTATDTATITFDWTEVANDAIAEGKISFSTACAAGNHYYLNGNDLACEADADTTYTNTSWDLGAITNAQCSNCITDANVVNTITVDGGTINWGTNTYSGTIGPTNLTVCTGTQILKMSGGVWTCAADALGSGDVKEAVYPLTNTTTTIALTDIFLNESGDDVTGNLNMDAANITDKNSNARIEFTGSGGIIFHLEA